MIPRYSRPQMTNIWSDDNKYKIWFEIEAYAVQAMEKLNLVPKGTAAHIWKNGKFNVDRILEIAEQSLQVGCWLCWYCDKYQGSDSRMNRGSMVGDPKSSACT